MVDGPDTELETRARILSWRRAERERLIPARLRIPVEERQAASHAIDHRLEQWCQRVQALRTGTVVSGYWPLRGEPDLRPWLARMHAAGFVCALPVVEVKNQPLSFRVWSPGCAMEKGFWNIPVPAARETVVPTLLLAPVVGFDRHCYRLGYGGGYFDRTLAALRERALAHTTVGIGLSMAALPSIQPLPHDIPLNAVVTESGLTTPPST